MNTAQYIDECKRIEKELAIPKALVLASWTISLTGRYQFFFRRPGYRFPFKTDSKWFVSWVDTYHVDNMFGYTHVTLVIREELTDTLNEYYARLDALHARWTRTPVSQARDIP